MKEQTKNEVANLAPLPIYYLLLLYTLSVAATWGSRGKGGKNEHYMDFIFPEEKADEGR